jgi:hypothetical protein
LHAACACQTSRRAGRSDIHTHDPNTTFIGSQQAHSQPGEGRLSTTRLTHQSQRLAPTNGERHPINRRLGRAMASIRETRILDLQQWLSVHHA